MRTYDVVTERQCGHGYGNGYGNGYGWTET